MWRKLFLFIALLGSTSDAMNASFFARTNASIVILFSSNQSDRLQFVLLIVSTVAMVTCFFKWSHRTLTEAEESPSPRRILMASSSVCHFTALVRARTLSFLRLILDRKYDDLQTFR
ncbi:unnamed protein product [Dicrocoelium dendriticum]|nr:unnamed protein product [Dicrocoelium dendriticum]